MRTLKELAEKIIDGEITGNQDQIVINWVHNKFKGKGLSDEAIDNKIDSAIRNFDKTKQKILKERQKPLSEPICHKRETKLSEAGA